MGAIDGILSGVYAVVLHDAVRLSFKMYGVAPDKVE